MGLRALPWPWRIFYAVFYLDVLTKSRGPGESEHFMFLDSDVVLAYPVTCASLFNPATGAPWSYYWPHIIWGNREGVTRIFNASTGARYLGSFMTYFPMVF